MPGARLPLGLRPQRPRRAGSERRRPARPSLRRRALLSSCSARSSAVTCAATPPSSDLAAHLGVHGRHRQRARHAARRTLLQETLLRSAAAPPSRAASRSGVEPRKHPPCPGGGGGTIRRHRPRCRLPYRRDRGAPAVRPHQELGYRYPDFSDGVDPAIRQPATICNDAFADRYPPNDHALLARARDRLESELALIDELKLAGFFLLHWEVLELARECALQVRGRDSPRRFLPPGRGRGSSVGSVVCYLTGLSHVDPVAHITSRSGPPACTERPRCRISTSTSPATSWWS